MNLTFLGASNMLSSGFNSNMILDVGEKSLLIDCGMDIKRSLLNAKRKVEEIDSIYISHLHSDHCGGLEYIAWYSYFVSKKKIHLFIHYSLTSDLWSMLSPSLSTIFGNGTKTIDDYFVVHEVSAMFTFYKNDFFIRPVKHINNVDGNVYSYAIECYGNINGKSKFFISTDTAEVCSPNSNLIFHDVDFCYSPQDAHVCYDFLRSLPIEMRNKMWLYHYNESLYDDVFDTVKKDGFAGLVRTGQVFEIDD